MTQIVIESPASILLKLLTVDGSGSGLDADVVRATTPTATGLSALSASNAAALLNAAGATAGVLPDSAITDALTISGGTINNTAIGGSTPLTGAFTTLSASSTVSGTGFSTYFASPPAIGGTSPAAGTFNPLTVSPSANTVPLTVSGYSLTGSNAQSLLDLSGTWNTSGTPSAIKLNITNTASNTASPLLDLQIASTSKFKVTQVGGVRATVSADSAQAPAYSFLSETNSGFDLSASTNGNIYGVLRGSQMFSIMGAGFIGTTGSFAIGAVIGAMDTIIARDAANSLAIRNTTNAQSFSLYNTASGSPGSNYERFRTYWSSNVLHEVNEAAGTGTVRARSIDDVKLLLPNIPTSDPHVVGQVYTLANALMVSAG